MSFAEDCDAFFLGRMPAYWSLDFDKKRSAIIIKIHDDLVSHWNELIPIKHDGWFEAIRKDYNQSNKFGNSLDSDLGFGECIKLSGTKDGFHEYCLTLSNEPSNITAEWASLMLISTYLDSKPDNFAETTCLYPQLFHLWIHGPITGFMSNPFEKWIQDHPRIPKCIGTMKIAWVMCGKTISPETETGFGAERKDNFILTCPGNHAMLILQQSGRIRSSIDSQEPLYIQQALTLLAGFAKIVSLAEKEIPLI